MARAELGGDSDRLDRSGGGPDDTVTADDTGTVDGTVTAGATPSGSRQPDGRQLLQAAHQAQLAIGSEPNGWFAGPHSDPDRFELLGPGLAGGEGNTWRARYKGKLAAPLTLAVKELRRPPHAPPDWPTAADVRRWEDQRALLQYMRIDHLVTVIDIFVGPPPHLPGLPDDLQRREPDTPYVAMEWVPGPTLADRFSGEPATASTLDERLAHVQHVAEALHALHSRTASAGNPTLHRDVKPTNCILDPRRGVVLVDVGTMRRVDDGYDHDGLHTPAYTAPEVLANPQAARGAASDLYSLGALAYFCVLGEDPPTAAQPGSAAQNRARLLAAASAAGVADGRGFVDHLGLMLDPSPEQRPVDAMSWARRLRLLAAVRGHRRPVRLRIAAAMLAVALVLVVAFIALRETGAGWPATDSAADSAAKPLASPNSTDTACADQPGPPGPPPGAPPPWSGVGPPPHGGVQAGPENAVRTELAAITAPGNGASVAWCAVIEGTSKLPAGRTLLLSVENLSVGGGVKHLRTLDGWQEPATLGRWRQAQFVGLPGDPAGARYRIEVFVVPLEALKNQAGGGSSNVGPSLPANSVIGASVFVVRAPTG